ncbi:F-Box Protein92 [Hibiscus trionum]|uniref:F-Box Protein92 n=1 Tax=Hibiscus trionum TaxID=183268 RepID=A0A9W7GVB4_HIBTR|nr:F-Box Protein92 [Hibiscus trionum]
MFSSRLYIVLVVCKDSKVLKKGQAATNMMHRLPREVVVHILSRLPLTSLLNSKLVCRAWRTLTQDPFLISNHLSHLAEAGNDPSFILQSNWPIPDQRHFIDFFDHSEGKVISKKLPTSTPPMHLVDSCNGLLCMSYNSRNLYICNPFTGLCIELPRLVQYPSKLGLLGFGFHQTRKEHKVIQIVFRRKLKRDHPNEDPSTLIQSEVQILTIGTPSWRTLETIPYRFKKSASKALVNGRFHWLLDPNKYTMASLLVSFDLETEQFQEVPKPDCCGSDMCLRHLLVVRGCLSAGAFHDDDGRLEIWVMKEYGVKESWIKEFRIGSYLPPTLIQQQTRHHFSYSRHNFPNLFARVLHVLRSGEILLEYKRRALVVYDPQCETFKEFTFPEMPAHWFKIIVHVGSLNWLEN